MSKCTSGVSPLGARALHRVRNTKFQTKFGQTLKLPTAPLPLMPPRPSSITFEAWSKGNDFVDVGLPFKNQFVQTIHATFSNHYPQTDMLWFTISHPCPITSRRTQKNFAPPLWLMKANKKYKFEDNFTKGNPTNNWAVLVNFRHKSNPILEKPSTSLLSPISPPLDQSRKPSVRLS